MSDPRKALPKDMREKAEKVTMAFASQVVDLLENVISEMVTAMSGEAPASAHRAAAKPAAKPAPKPAAKPAPKPAAKPAPKPAAKPAPKPVAKPAPKPVAKASAVPTPADNHGDIKKRIVAALRKARVPMSVEQLNRVLGSKTTDLTVPLQEMLAAGQLAKTGVARGTKYGIA